MSKAIEKKDFEKRILKLRKELNYHSHLYHVLDKPEISDAAWDSLKNELKKIEKEYPSLITPDSPTQRVGEYPLKKFIKVSHPKPMLSIDDVFDFSEIENWEDYLQDYYKKKITYFKKSPGRFDYYCERKIDGVDIVLTYKKGILVQGATRGNGLVGENVTINIKTIGAIPLKIKKPIDIVVRGEIFMSQKNFEKLKKKRKEKKLSLFANPRNLVAGSIRQLASRVTSLRRLDCYIFEIISDIGQKTHQQVHKMLQELGFKIDIQTEYCRNLKEVKKYYDYQLKKRPNASFAYDGVVVLVNNIVKQNILGAIGKSPRWERAYKFPGEQATSVVENILIQVGRTGALTPVAILRPTKLGGSIVSRATLHNENEIIRLGVKIKDTVIIEKAGDIIPAVVKVLKNLRTGGEKGFRMPIHCPVCQSKVIRHSGEVAHYCPNKNCFAVRLRSINHFVSKKGFNVEGLGPKIVNQLMNSGLIKDATEIFTLKKGDLSLLDRFAEKSADNLIKAIEQSKKISFSNFIYALGIRHIGEQTSIDLTNYFVNLERLKKSSLSVLINIPGMGTKMGESIYSWFDDIGNVEFLERLKKSGLEIIYPKRKFNQPLQNKNFVLTGSLSNMTREMATRKIRNLGGQVSGNVGIKTDFLICGQNSGSKYEKAQKAKIKILSESQFLQFLNKIE